MTSVRARAWALFDRIVATASEDGYATPWHARPDAPAQYMPDYGTLRRLLGVPLMLSANSQSGVPALALDVWVAFELRRCGLEADAVWPRAQAPRVLPTEIQALLRARDLPGALRTELAAHVAAGRGVGSASANILGKNYVKQVDVVVSAWNTGPELLISTKRMDSSFGKNAANRVEESYGDAKNLRLRYPQAALGFLYGLRATAFTLEPEKAEWLVDLLTKLGQEDDAYHAVGLIVPEWEAAPDADSADDGSADPLVAAGVQRAPVDAGEAADMRENDLDTQLSSLPAVQLRFDHVPPELDPARFFDVMVRRVLKSSPITFHVEARQRLKAASADGER
ncbi:hypothetical protein [Dactylosporangium sp. NPDC005555]|uniref:hypothetical protein n=1 Tax=Dactylosporangium sp. NPDC005555 TaxID=3154889 RepID=UPI0033B49DB2